MLNRAVLGTGLGLAISRNFIQSMDISVESELGKGTNIKHSTMLNKKGAIAIVMIGTFFNKFSFEVTGIHREPNG